MEVIWSQKKYKEGWCEYMKIIMKDRTKWLQKNKKTMKQKTKNYKKLLSVKLLYKSTFQKLAVKSMYTLESNFIDLNKYIKYDEEGFLIKIKNDSLTSMINLTNVNPFVILFFEENSKFKGASYSLNNVKGSYHIQTQYKTILFMKHPNTLNLKNIEHLSFIENS